MLESNRQDKDYPSRNNIAIVDSLSAKVKLSLLRRVRESQVSALRTNLKDHNEDWNKTENGGGASKVWDFPTSNSSLETWQTGSGEILQ